MVKNWFEQEKSDEEKKKWNDIGLTKNLKFHNDAELHLDNFQNSITKWKNEKIDSMNKKKNSKINYNKTPKFKKHQNSPENPNRSAKWKKNDRGGVRTHALSDCGLNAAP